MEGKWLEMEDEGPLFSQRMVASRKSRRMAPLCYSNVGRVAQEWRLPCALEAGVGLLQEKCFFFPVGTKIQDEEQ